MGRPKGSGTYKKGNRCAEKPKKCPYCGEIVKIANYVYLRKRDKKT